uniref:Beta-Casp domain-containing protein n=1 Tax=Gongylonema pulchrum TaxID=637853 RepID=A0A183EKU7_9BILA
LAILQIGYLSATSSRNSHTKPVQWDQLRGVDALILTSVCRFPEHNPETSVCNAFAVIADTLKRNGSVLMPICPTGIVYDLLEVISAQLDQHDVSVDVPVYFISPVAESTLAYSNIYAEWLSEKKQNMVNIPEEPFKHGVHDVSVDVPVYFISPVAESTLAYSNIYAEWLSEKKQNMVNIPEEPFKHGVVGF